MTNDLIRDHLANERTFLAWVRTSIALLGFGIVIAKLRFLISETASTGHLGTSGAAESGSHSVLLGLLFCATGVVTLLFATVQYLKTRRMIESGAYSPPGAELVIFILVLCILAVASILFLLMIGQ